MMGKHTPAVVCFEAARVSSGLGDWRTMLRLPEASELSESEPEVGKLTHLIPGIYKRLPLFRMRVSQHPAPSANNWGSFYWFRVKKAGILGVAVKCVDIKWNTSGEGESLDIS